MSIDDGFKLNECDSCVLNRTSGDMLVTSKDITHISAVKNMIELHFDEVKQKLGASITYVGMNCPRLLTSPEGLTRWRSP